MDYPFSILNDPLESMTLKTFPDWACRIIKIIELSVKLPICHFYSHLVLMGPRTGLWRTVTLLTSFTTKIQRKKIQQLLVQLLVVARLWTVSFHFPSQPIRTPVSSNSICSKSSMVHQTLVTKVPFWNQVGTFGWNMALFVNQCQTCCSLNSIR